MDTDIEIITNLINNKGIGTFSDEQKQKLNRTGLVSIGETKESYFISVYNYNIVKKNGNVTVNLLKDMENMIINDKLKKFLYD